MLAPGPADDPAQYVDGRDMADWIVAMVGRGAGGVFHAAGPSPTFTWGEELATVADAVGPAGTLLQWVDGALLLEHGMDGHALPLWSSGDAGRWVMAVDPAAAFAAGLRMRPLIDTVRDTLAWALATDQPAAPGLSGERERELLESADKTAE